MHKYKTIIVGSIIIMAMFMTGCVEQQDDIDTQVGEGNLKLKLTDKPGDLDIIYANVTISNVMVHKANADNDEEEDNDNEIENIDEYDDGFISDGNGPYFGDVGEDILFEGNATEGLDEPYNWSWDFGDGEISYEQNATHNYSSDGEYIVNLTVTNDSGNGVSDWYITTAMIGEIDDDEDNSTAGWYTIVNESQTFDLIALQNVTEVLGENILSVGKYTQIRLTVEEAEITINNSGTKEVHDMKIPSSKVKLVKSFWIYENETTELTLDFDVYESVHQTGNNKFIMKPTIKIIEG
jgi:PKD repeat protein